MKRDEVPQDQSPTLAGQRKALYALDENGHYTVVPSSGWEPEELVLDQAVAEFNRQALTAWQDARAGSGSPLAYHMFQARMDPTVLAQATGIMRWRVKRHLKASAFARLKPALLERYADALGMDISQLKQLPDQPPA